MSRRSNNSGQKVAILVGHGARHARAQVEQIADVLGAGVAKALLGKDVLPDTCRSSPAPSGCSAPARYTS